MRGSKDYSYHNPNKKTDDEDDGCCNLSCLKFSLYIYNLVSLLCGMALLALSLWLIIAKEQVLFVYSVYYGIFPWVILAIGGLIVLMTVLGCCGISRENSCLLYTYAVFCGVLILIQLAGGLAAYTFKDEVHTQIIKTIKTSMLEDYGLENSSTSAMDTLQEQLHCCGAQSFEDWTESAWSQLPQRGSNKVPDSCCKTVSVNCGVRDHPSNIYYTGCGDALFVVASSHLILLGSLATIVAVIQIVGLILSLKLGAATKNLDQ
eukprot:TRINITY_DN13615_c0_g1_i1.p1 TRINITY_DN13615_c0_g1~~TRINITY_DN13615_c0_g1_i1.p1  ORF type:complete len:274 (+),score=26.02 TRINITY_DN13615_c0_g1_i1:37-822(+)